MLWLTVHFADDLELLLQDQLLADFNAQIEDGSPRQVAKQLVALHNELIQQRITLLEQLRAAAPSGASGSTMQQMDLDGTVINGPQGSMSSSSGSGDEDDEMHDVSAAPAQHQPVIDDDGFQLVQTKSKGRGRYR